MLYILYITLKGLWQFTLCYKIPPYVPLNIQSNIKNWKMIDFDRRRRPTFWSKYQPRLKIPLQNYSLPLCFPERWFLSTKYWPYWPMNLITDRLWIQLKRPFVIRQNPYLLVHLGWNHEEYLLLIDFFGLSASSRIWSAINCGQSNEL